ncbi:MAG: 16S rRNA (adenine(1518)-N(6)/adenine(1519)-N(6))-dimethyltransferase, partial [Candidatus Omnitrophica bacterium]|nr:16S rRNA (adenine(1518)-N(6)/adenine(1519)-N(6))-dimethyltransferase [Candidatus Omnitrophota bacterium]
VFITVQKELGRRMTAHPGSKEYGSLSCFVQYYTKAKILFLIKKTCFRPMPKVDSCFLRLKIATEPQVKVNNKKRFFKIIRAGFNKRRKTLRNSLRGIISPSKLQTFFDKYGIDINIRPECLTLEDFANLANI